MAEKDVESIGKDSGTNDLSAEFKGAPSAAEAFSGWYEKWKPWTVVGKCSRKNASIP